MLEPSVGQVYTRRQRGVSQRRTSRIVLKPQDRAQAETSHLSVPSSRGIRGTSGPEVFEKFGSSGPTTLRLTAREICFLASSAAVLLVVTGDHMLLLFQPLASSWPNFLADSRRVTLLQFTTGFLGGAGKEMGKE